MELLTTVFRQLLSMAAMALPVMALVLAFRLCLGKAPKKYSYVLWVAVGLRLACPFLPESPVGLPRPETLAQTVSEALTAGPSQAADASGTADHAGEAAPAVSPETPPEPAAPAGSRPAAAPAARKAADRGGKWMETGAVVWLAGLGGMLAYIAVSDVRLRRRLATAVLREDNVWECGGIPTPFVLGLFRPRIYVPFRMAEARRVYVLAHERHHIRRGDHWAKALALLLLAVYWWDPAVWLCWRLFCRDMEMSCDEAVLARLGDSAKGEYSLSLVSFALERQAPMALAFGEHDAARRVKNVLNWKRAGPMVTFLALAAVVLVTVVCGTDAERGSRLKAEHTGSTVSLTCGMKAPIRSWAIWEDVYENGKLVSSRPCVSDGFQEDGGASPRDLRMTLSVPAVYAEEGGFAGTLEARFTGVGSVAWDTDLPKDHYTGMDSVLGDGSEEGSARWKLEDDGSVALYTVMFSARPDGAIRLGGTADNALFANDTVLQYRFVTSTLPLEELTADSSLARTLFSLRTDSVTDTEQITAILNILGVSRWGSFQVSGGRDMGEMRVRVAFDAELAGSPGFAPYMENVGYLLQALVGDAGVAEYTTGEATTSLFSSGPVYNWAREQGYDGLKDMAKTVEGLRALMNHLGWEGAFYDPLEELARTLYAGRGDPEALLSAMENFEEPLGRYELQEAAGDSLSLLFYDSPVAAEKRSTLMWRYSMVLLALLDDCAATTWNWIDGGVQALPQNDGLWNTDSWLQAHGLAGTIRDYGASPRAVETLLEALYPQSGNGAPVSELGASLFALRGETALLVKAIPERLIGLEGWEVTADGVLELSVSGTLSEIADGGEGRMSSASCLLAALLPEEVWAVRWTVAGRPVQFSYMEDHDPGGDLFTDAAAFTWTEHRSGEGLYVRSCGLSASGMTLLLDKLGIGGESLPIQTAEAFTDILGYDGFLWQEHQGGSARWSLRTYYAVTAEGTFPIAESFGWGEREDYSVDLDGDGQKELVCNVTFGGDGARRAYVYQRRDDGIWQSSVTPEGLPGYEHSGVGSSWEEYDPAENLFRIHYHKKGQEDYAVAEVRGMEQLEEFYPYS